jgi:hypothetical protein
MIELDAYPPVTTPRRRPDGELPPGMAMVSFDVDLVAGSDGAHALLPGRRQCPTTTFRGAAGEWVELVETVGA